ncbi:MAG: sigma-54-dependent Fis family transcriptional regulator, partial [Pseudomonadales bacterium]|nr:sigma-54-dependent Fis family transcriptional regulator [Pseudomonadales bacterium]
IIRKALRKLLERNRFEVIEAASVQEASNRGFDELALVISDVRLPGAPGTDLIEMAKPVPVLIMTSYGSMRSAVEAMKQGAVDYISKPFDHKEMIETVERIIGESTKTDSSLNEKPLPSLKATSTQQSSTHTPTSSEPAGSQLQDFITGSSDAMRSMMKKIDMLAPTDTIALITGETGTGKELVATLIHNKSPRKDRPFITVNCASMPEAIIEAELFGYEKGAISHTDRSHIGLIAAADGGTLFLDEIGELPLEAQARLLTVLQENRVRPIGSIASHPVNVRVIASTHQNLKDLCSQGLFREDLFFRINVIQINIPPLREREQDIIKLAEHFLKLHAENMGKQIPTLSDSARQALLEHSWPGNVRELQNVMQRTLILSEGASELQSQHFDLQNNKPESADSAPGHRLQENTSAAPTMDKVSLDDYFRNFVLENQGSMSETALAKQLGISRKSLWEKRQRLGIPKKTGK